MDVPERFRSYPCDDYFRDGWYARGHFDDDSQLSVVTPLDDTYEREDVEFFAIGRSGCDGIDFGYRKGQPGLWAYYPIDREFTLVASSVAELIDAWVSGRLLV